MKGKSSVQIFEFARKAPNLSFTAELQNNLYIVIQSFGFFLDSRLEFSFVVLFVYSSRIALG